MKVSKAEWNQIVERNEWLEAEARALRSTLAQIVAIGTGHDEPSERAAR